MEADYEQGKKDLAEQIYAILKQHKNEDWRDLMEVLEKHLKEGIMEEYICKSDTKGRKCVDARELTYGIDFQLRTGLSFAGKAILLNAPPAGFEWVMGQDETGFLIVFQKRL